MGFRRFSDDIDHVIEKSCHVVICTGASVCIQGPPI